LDLLTSAPRSHHLPAGRLSALTSLSLSKSPLYIME
jgi:hypothetical protein